MRRSPQLRQKPRLLQLNANVRHAARLAKRHRTDFQKLLGRHQSTPEEFTQR
jgi:hypothetical protein